MAMLRLRASAPHSGVDPLIELLSENGGVERAEAISNLIPHRVDENSSSGGLSENMGGQTPVVEIEAGGESSLQRKRRVLRGLRGHV